MRSSSSKMAAGIWWWSSCGWEETNREAAMLTESRSRQGSVLLSGKRAGVGTRQRPRRAAPTKSSSASPTTGIPHRVDLPRGHGPTPQGELHHATGEALPRHRGGVLAKLDCRSSTPPLCASPPLRAGDVAVVARREQKDGAAPIFPTLPSPTHPAAPTHPSSCSSWRQCGCCGRRQEEMRPGGVTVGVSWRGGGGEKKERGKGE